jgi:hypothetical protein
MLNKCGIVAAEVYRSRSGQKKLDVTWFWEFRGFYMCQTGLRPLQLELRQRSAVFRTARRDLR